MNMHVGPIIVSTLVKRRTKLMDEIESAICADCWSTYESLECKKADCSLTKVKKLLCDMWDEDGAESDALEDQDEGI